MFLDSLSVVNFETIFMICNAYDLVLGLGMVFIILLNAALINE